MHVLLSRDDLGGWAPGHEEVLDPGALALAYAYPLLSVDEVWVRANFVSTLDGAATGDDGRSGSLGTGADHDVFGLLRALSDVVLVGAGTARSEGYRRAQVRTPWLELRANRPAHPTMAVVTRSGRVPSGLSEARQDSGEVLLITCEQAGEGAIDLARSALGKDHVIVVGEASVDLSAAVDALAVRGLRRILCEGGPHLLRELTASGRLDELCLTLVPTLIGGDHPRITAGAAAIAHLTPRLLIESEGTILGRWARH